MEPSTVPVQGSFSVQFFDLVAHVMPGALVLAIAVSLGAPDAWAALAATESAALVLAAAFVASFVAGFIVQTALTSLQGAYGKLLRGDDRIFDRLLQQDPHITETRELATRLLGFAPGVQAGEKVDRVLFRFAETVVEDQMAARWTAARRVMALATLARNLSAPVAFSLVLVAVQAPRLGLEWSIAAAFGAILLTVLLLWNWRVYWKRSIGYTLQAFVFWCRRTERDEQARSEHDHAWRQLAADAVAGLSSVRPEAQRPDREPFWTRWWR